LANSANCRLTLDTGRSKRKSCFVSAQSSHWPTYLLGLPSRLFFALGAWMRFIVDPTFRTAG